ncbi:MAG: hypothetical protein JWQ14_2413 [Adhaeribacter sp.]|nr:hypothetical protein [Adhaeribacter sp.]
MKQILKKQLKKNTKTTGGSSRTGAYHVVGQPVKITPISISGFINLGVKNKISLNYIYGSSEVTLPNISYKKNNYNLLIAHTNTNILPSVKKKHNQEEKDFTMNDKEWIDKINAKSITLKDIL